MGTQGILFSWDTGKWFCGLTKSCSQLPKSMQGFKTEKQNKHLKRRAKAGGHRKNKKEVIKRIEQKMKFAATFYCLHKSEDADHCGQCEVGEGN